MHQKQNRITVRIFSVLFACAVLCCWLWPRAEFSAGERRKLAQLPTFTVQRFLNGKYASEFESFALDQFPLRESWRTLKALFSREIYRRPDNNGIYLEKGYAAQLEYPLSTDSIDHAAQRFGDLYQQYLEGTAGNVYLSIVPDKGYFLAEENGYPAMDYAALVARLREGMPYAQYIDIFPTLSLGDYYKTDTHWRQEALADTAAALASGMGTTLADTYTAVSVEVPFYGVYRGQSALPLPADSLQYITNETIEGCTVYDGENGKDIPVYNLEKAAGRDPYEMYLSGSLSLITVTNPNSDSGKKLILFRDSFGSSIAPYLFEAYDSVTLVDPRYMVPDYLGRFVDFEDSDVLFLFSTLVLNNSETIK